MLLEVPLSMMAWVGVVIIQAIVHFGIIGPRRKRTEEQLPGVTEEVDSFQLDEDEEDFEKLLSQTGDEVISLIRSNSFIERQARAQLDRDKNE
mmetsp:Transcript_29294/g.48420  ORF Transcript_29294/g.48420 Transcript_29294/m.48420 type:complete len:93 (-) Transcript_29294:255-533(-)|eukprot:CAMPEP_0119012078 /NCGR_PEP_ID=MMETSP1176-20130426/6066_1 /TAXON_ID=265551 /ORGANISM="Synedropsis recta cf, Strain CCMP1620" /LENGTH=92 /DNA_ID=CAMNT_0006964983 /DNA_START=200 /DNA_END=478 /DNA_ORIENTATION=+